MITRLFSPRMIWSLRVSYEEASRALDPELQVDMQVRPVRMEQSPATRLWTAGTPHHCGALFTARRSDMGTLLSLLCLRRGVPIIILGQHGSDCIPIVFPTREKRSAIPPCAPSIRRRNRTSSRRFRHLEDLTDYWIGGLPVYQAGRAAFRF